MAINITLANGQLGGTQQIADGVFGLVMTGSPDAGGYVLGTPLLITGMADLAVAGMSVGSNPLAIKQISEFYLEAGEGASLYVMLVANTIAIDSMCVNSNTNGVSKLLNYANGKIKVLGVMTDDTVVTVGGTTSGMNDAVVTAVENLQDTATTWAAAQKPFRGIVAGTSYQVGMAGTLPDFTDGGPFNRVCVLIGDTDLTYSNLGAALGLVLGRLSTLPVMRKLSRVKTGAMKNTAAYLGANALESDAGEAVTIANKAYITWTSYPNLLGYYMSGDPTGTPATDDYHFLARGRIVDKAQVLTYGVFVQEVDDEVPVNGDGTIDSGFATHLQNQMVQTLNTAMASQGEISAAYCYINPAQNILATGQLNVVVKVTPPGYASDIEIVLGFYNPANG